MTLIFAFLFGVPALIYILYLYVKKPWTGFLMTVVLNYFIMGSTRYVNLPIPISVLIEAIYIFQLIVLFTNRERFKEEGKIPVSILAIFGLWTLYCTLQIINDTCNLGLNIVGWFREVRFYGFDPLLGMLIFAMAICSKKDISKLLSVIGVILILAGIKCFMQKYRGFDAGEAQWLANGGAVTHIIYAGTFIRYFSFFTDAANYGSHCGIMAAIFGILMIFIPNKQWKKKLFYAVVAIACLYGMFLSGARAAVYVFIGTLIAYVFLSRNAKMFGATLAGILLFVGFLMFTDRGNGIDSIRRMRSAFNLEDASVQVRDHNQEAISKYMGEAPLGIGFGRDYRTVPTYSRYRIVATTAPDSTLVYLWTRTGIVGLCLFCFVSALILLRCTIIVWFKIKDPELRTMCGTFTAAGAGWFFAGYANDTYFQYPNAFVVLGLLTIVFMAPFLDSKLEEEKEKKALEELEEKEVDTIND